MKNILFLVIFTILTSYSCVENIIPNGSYKAVIDKEYDALGFDFNINNDKFYLIKVDKMEEFDIIWEAENRIRVVGYLEPLKYPDILKGEKIYGYFEVKIIDDNNYSFKVKLIDDDYVLFAGKFIKE